MIGQTDYLKVKRTESSVNIGEYRYHYLYNINSVKLFRVV